MTRVLLSPWCLWSPICTMFCWRILWLQMVEQMMRVLPLTRQMIGLVMIPLLRRRMNLVLSQEILSLELCFVARQHKLQLQVDVLMVFGSNCRVVLSRTSEPPYYVITVIRFGLRVLSPIHTEQRWKQTRKFSSMFVIYSVILIACSFCSHFRAVWIGTWSYGRYINQIHTYKGNLFSSVFWLWRLIYIVRYTLGLRLQTRWLHVLCHCTDLDSDSDLHPDPLSLLYPFWDRYPYPDRDRSPYPAM